MKILEVNNINKTFVRLKAVDNLSFSIEEGTVFGLLGPNGAGKTTTIRMIMNIIIPDSGSISVLGSSNIADANQIIGYLPEERGIYRKMKVFEVLLFLARLKSMKRKEALQAINFWLEKLDLQNWKHTKVEELSKGMQQKLQIISAIIHKPKLLILDEPFMGLDPINTNIIKEVLLQLKTEGVTIIFSTHLMDNVEKLCEDILLINKGKNILNGKLSDIKNRYGKRNIHLKYQGNGSFLSDSPFIESYDNFGNYVEIKIKKDADPQQFLHEVSSKVSISRFEIIEPSLNDIFIKTVKETKEATNE